MDGRRCPCAALDEAQEGTSLEASLVEKNLETGTLLQRHPPSMSIHGLNEQMKE